jgi:hypothetical protein
MRFGSAGDSPVQSINSCLAMQHLSTYAHAVVLLDNQALLDQLNFKSGSSSTRGDAGSSTGSQVQQRVARKPAGSAGVQTHVFAHV